MNFNLLSGSYSFRKLFWLGVKFSVAGFMLGVVFASYSFAQEGAQEGSGIVNIVKEEKKVTALDIRGNRGISTSVILSKIKTRLNHNYSVHIARDDIKRLYNTGFFSDIRIELEDFKDGVKVIFLVTENPIIKKISFKGLKSVGQKKTLSVINSRVNQHLDYLKLKQDIKEIKALYANKGFSNVSIKHNVSLDNTEENANIEFVIDEGKRIKVRKVTVEGAISFKEKRILKLMKTKKKSWWFSAGLLKEDVLAEDIERITAFYRAKGFIDVEVSKDIDRDMAAGHIYITIIIDEGQQYRIGNIRIKGNVIADTFALEREIGRASCRERV